MKVCYIVFSMIKIQNLSSATQSKLPLFCNNGMILLQLGITDHLDLMSRNIRKCIDCRLYKPSNLKLVFLTQTPLFDQRFECNDLLCNICSNDLPCNIYNNDLPCNICSNDTIVVTLKKRSNLPLLKFVVIVYAYCVHYNHFTTETYFISELIIPL